MTDMLEQTDEIGMQEDGKVEWPETKVRFPWRKDAPLPNLKAVVILTEGVRGHLNQSRGVANWLVRRTGAEVLELEVPIPSGVRRSTLRTAAARLLEGNRRKARDWLALAEGESIIRTLGQWLMVRNIREGEPQSLLLLSAGTLPAFYNVALGYIWRCSCATIMTPSVIGTEPFDFAIVPEHDYPKDVSNVLTTVGAPNLIVREELGSAAESLLSEFPPQGERRWGILLGGDDKNYQVTPEWVQKQLGKIFHEAERSNVDLYIATSRRTSRQRTRRWPTAEARPGSTSPPRSRRRRSGTDWRWRRRNRATSRPSPRASGPPCSRCGSRNCTAAPRSWGRNR